MSATAATLVCALLAGGAAGLAMPRPLRIAAAAGPGRQPAWLVAGGAGLLALGAVTGLPGDWLVLGAVGIGVSGWIRAVVVRQRRRRARSRTADGVLEACETLAAELAAGSPGDRALARASEACTPLVGAVDAQRWGTDVPAALRRAADQPGADDLRLLAAAWQVAHRSGQGLAVTVDRIVLRLRAERRTGRIVDSELASARSTARLVAALPLVAWGMGAGAGSSPWSFLLGGPIGVGVLVAGLVLMLGGLWWIEALADRVWQR